MALKRDRSKTPEDGQASQVYISSTIEDRASRFIGFYSPVQDGKSLRSLPDTDGAMHKMTAWRVKSKQRSLNSRPLFDLDHDDDGERYGGKTIEKVLTTRQVEGTVIVARWYGGVLLGPVRFDHIRNCANEAISAWQQAEDPSRKKPKGEEVEADKETLIGILKERDQSVSVLRELLVEKSASQSHPDTANQTATPQSKAEAIDYTGMPVKTLRQLEQARDKTIAWLLAQIDKAEESQREDG